jgi:L-ascorbate metabolism protein UlaG (beta-lactamase superfamily)
MKITKFAQSSVMIETNDTKILVDPGYLSSETEIEQMIGIDYVFVTHKHGDHFNEDIYNKIKKETTKVYSTNEVATSNPGTQFEILKETDNLTFESFKVKVVKAVHGYQPFLTTNNAEINENVGYIFEIENKKLYFTSDSISFKNNYHCDILFVPTCNHGLVMDPFSAAQFAKATNTNLIIPIHNDNPKYLGDLEKIKEEFDKIKIEYAILEKSQSIEI